VGAGSPAEDWVRARWVVPSLASLGPRRGATLPTALTTTIGSMGSTICGGVPSAPSAPSQQGSDGKEFETPLNYFVLSKDSAIKSGVGSSIPPAPTPRAPVRRSPGVWAAMQPWGSVGQRRAVVAESRRGERRPKTPVFPFLFFRVDTASKKKPEDNNC